MLSWIPNTHHSVALWHLTFQPSLVCAVWWGLLKPGLGRGTASVCNLTVACSSHVKNLLLSCGTWRGEGSRESMHSPHSSPNIYEGAVARNGSSEGIPEVHTASEGYLRYVTFVWHIFVLWTKEVRVSDVGFSPSFIESNIRGEQEVLVLSGKRVKHMKVGEEHLRIHSHSKQLCRKEVTRSKEKHINNPERESSWLPVCLYLAEKSLASRVRL